LRRWGFALSLTVLALIPQAADAFQGSNGRIAYSSGGSLSTVKADGTERASVGSNSSDADPAFSPLGLRIAVERDTTTSNRDIWIMHSNGSGQRRLTNASDTEEDPAWSPDGGKLAYTRVVSGNRDIYTANADGTNVRRLTTSSYAEYSPAWSHSGKIAFVRTLSGNNEIYTMNPDGSGLRRVTSRSAQDTSPSWSPDSGKISFVSNGDVYTVRPDGGGLQRLTTGGGLDPSFAPDGSKIAFVRGSAGDREVHVMNTDGSGVQKLTTESADARDPDWQSTGHDPVIAGAGDIACDPASTYFNGGAGTLTDCRHRYTANPLLNMDLNKLITIGDLQYTEGTLNQFDASYNPSWGLDAMKGITAPSVGNHEYRTPGAADYFDYFNGAGSSSGPAGDRDKGYYSYDLGDKWHIVVLNSDCGYPLPSANVPGGCGAGSPQEEWLRADLAASKRPCTLAYFHHPHFRSGTDAASGHQKAFWRALYDAGADLVLNGHDHNYQRLAPQDPDGRLDTSRGIRQIVVGSGGKSLVASDPVPNTEVNHSSTYGVLKLTLRPARYEWKFVPEAGRTFTDSGSTSCHAKPSASVAAPTKLTATNGDRKVSLAWSHPAGSEIDGYNVYRSSTPGGPYTKINGSVVPTVGSDTEATYTDMGVENGTRYYYVVKAVKSGTESAASNEVSANPTSSPRYRDKVFTTSGLISYWRLGEASGTRAADEKGVYPGYYEGGPALGEPGALSGDADTAARFDGTNDEMDAGGSSLALTTEGTLEGWFKWDSGVALLRDSTLDGGWILAYDSGGKLAYRVGGATYTTDRTTASVRDGWHHFALTAASGDTAFYVDGALVHRGVDAGRTMAQMPWHVMRNGNQTTQFTQGLADELALYGRALPIETLQEHYGAGSGDTTPPTGPAGLTATAGNASVSLDWADNSESDVGGYDVYRSRSPGGPYEKVNGSRLSRSEHTDTGLSNGTTYHYVVKAVDTSANASANSSEVTATPGQRSYRETVLGTSGLVSYWRLGEASGTSARDEKLINPGSYVGGAALGRQPGAIANDPDPAVGFAAGSNDFVDLDDVSLGEGNGFSVEAWVKTTGSRTNEWIVGEGSTLSPTPIWGLVHEGANARAYLRSDSAAANVVGSRAINDGQWHHLIVTVERPGSISLYVDGSLDGTSAAPTGNMALDASTIGILRRSTLGSELGGEVDEVSTYDRVLSNATVQDHYRQGAP
jgi:acid phosphatase type 7